jgi:hypothetical protein
MQVRETHCPALTLRDLKSDFRLLSQRVRTFRLPFLRKKKGGVLGLHPLHFNRLVSGLFVIARDLRIGDTG